MLERLCIVAVVGVLWAAQAQSQDLSDRAGSSVGGLGAITDLLTQGNIDTAVVPFETASPDEVTLDPSEFDAQEVLIQQSDGIEGRALSATIDSFATRPEVDLGEDPLALADDAVEQSEAVVGGLFSEAGGSCSATFDGGQFSGEQLCRAIVGRDTHDCLETRSITVDREDHWECDIEVDTYQTSCLKPVEYSCTGASDGSCRQAAVTVNGQSSQWLSSDTVLEVALPMAGNAGSSSCNITVETFDIEVSSIAQLDAFKISGLSYTGAVQIHVNGQGVATFDSDGSLVPAIESDGVTYNPRALWESGNGDLLAAYWELNPNAGQPGEPNILGFLSTAVLQDCNASSKIVGADIDLLELLDDITPPFWTVENDQLTQNGVASTQSVSISVTRANLGETIPPEVRVSVDGGCCSEITASDGGQC